MCLRALSSLSVVFWWEDCETATTETYYIIERASGREKERSSKRRLEKVKHEFVNETIKGDSNKI